MENSTATITTASAGSPPVQANGLKQKPLLALPGPAFPPANFFGADGFAVGDGAVWLEPPATVLTELAHEDHRVQTASSVWDCAVVLIKFLERVLTVVSKDTAEAADEEEKREEDKEQEENNSLHPSTLGEELVSGGGINALPSPQPAASAAAAAQVARPFTLSELALCIRRARTIIELGAGTGAVGLGAAALLPNAAAHILLTDVPAAVPALVRNAQLNNNKQQTSNKTVDDLGASGSGACCSTAAVTVDAAPLDWVAWPKDGLHKDVEAIFPFDLVLAADVVWVEDLIEPLVHTMVKLCAPDGAVLLAHQTRSVRADRTLFQLISRHFTKILVPARELHQTYRLPDKIRVFLLRPI